MTVDITRSTFDPAKHYNSVRMQQGRVQLDAEWNEQADIAAHRVESETMDVIGMCGAPVENGGFELSLTPDGLDLFISPGRLYVDGILCELEATPILITGQPAAQSITAQSIMADDRIFEVKDWVRITSTNDPTVDSILQISAIDLASHTLAFNGPVPAGATHVRRITTFLTQPDYTPTDDEINAVGKLNQLAYVKVWSQDITALDDENIVEIALNVPDTTTRRKTVWQVRLLDLSSVAPNLLTCEAEIPDWTTLVSRTSDKLQAHCTPTATSADPCLTPPGGGYNGAENQLYRVEIHDVSGGVVTFKWSRDGASVFSAWTDQSQNEITVGSLGPDATRGLVSASLVELTDESRKLTGQPGTLVKVTQTRQEDNVLVIDPTPIRPAAGSVTRSKFPLVPRVVRWEGYGTADTTWIPLENGVEIQFEQNGNYQVGDYWLIPARAAIGSVAGDILWPRAAPNDPLFMTPNGIQYHYCRLAIVSPDSSPFVTDCRPLFPPLTGLITMHYAGGDGQEVPAGGILPEPLIASVTQWQFPVAGAQVRFSIIDGKGALAPNTAGAPGSTLTQLTVLTDSEGLARCYWRFGPDLPNQSVEAVLLDNPAPQRGYAPIIYSATQLVADQIGYQTMCDPLSKVTNVQDALDLLCKLLSEINSESAIHIKDVTVNDTRLSYMGEIDIDSLATGIQITCDQPVDGSAFPGQPKPPTRTVDKPSPQPKTPTRSPICYVAVDIPYPLTTDDSKNIGTRETVGFQPLILADQVTTNDVNITWSPLPSAVEWLTQDLFNFGLPDQFDRVLCHLTLKGNFIWAAKDATIYLDGEAYGVFSDANFPNNLRLPSGNGIRGGDFEMWFWLLRPRQFVRPPVFHPDGPTLIR